MMQIVWAESGLNPDNYTAATGDAMKRFAILFANHVGNRSMPEYSKSSNKWRWWDNHLRDYKFGTTEDLMAQFIVQEPQNSGGE